MKISIFYKFKKKNMVLSKKQNWYFAELNYQMLPQKNVESIVLMVFSLHKKTKGLVNLLIVTVASHEISLANDYL